MNSRPLSLLAAVCAAATPVVFAQDEVRPPKAVPVPEEVPEEIQPAEPAPGLPPKAKPVEDGEPVPDDPPPDQPWEPEEDRKAREQEEAKLQEEQEKARREMERQMEEKEKEENEAIKVRAVPKESTLPTVPQTPREPKIEKPKIPIAKDTDPNAKPLSLLVPGPRGLIVDRNGQPLAQNRIAHYIGLQLPMQEGLKDAEILSRARSSLAFCQAQLTDNWNLSDADILAHYKKRRWVPFYSPSLVPDDRVSGLKASLPPDVVLRPLFLRTYPEKALAGHLIGHMGKNENGFFNAHNLDLQSEELMWPPTAGRNGLEKRFEKELAGEPGSYSALFDSSGKKLAEESTRPRAGHTVVTTLDIEMQKIVERKMREEDVRGAFVIMDVKTGDVVTMASTPCFDPNDWVYGVNDEYYQKQLNHPEKPLFCRSLQGLYPPASTFKIITCLAALETDNFGPHSELTCPPGMYFNKVYIRNHSKNHEGSMDVERAIMRSCNTWMFQAAQISGPGALSSMAIRFGYGDKTGICLDHMELPGFMPTPEYYASRKGRMTGGILAITSIGQGMVLSTPLQVCQMMAGVARGDAVPRPRLVRLVQDVDGRVVQYFPPSTRAPLGLDPVNLDAVRRGMRDVVYGGGGTGSRASNNYVTIAGKTGTGEWKESRGTKQYVAWFGGFIPYKNPEYAYVCLYEGDPGDSISGGRKVAPIVGDVFNDIYKAKKNRGEIQKPDPEEQEELAKVRATKRAETAPAPAAIVSAPPPPPEKPKRGLRWLFGRKKQPQPPGPPPPANRAPGR
jgi:penicillin-binding protein 2